MVKTVKSMYENELILTHELVKASDSDGIDTFQ